MRNHWENQCCRDADHAGAGMAFNKPGCGSAGAERRFSEIWAGQATGRACLCDSTRQDKRRCLHARASKTSLAGWLWRPGNKVRPRLELLFVVDAVPASEHMYPQKRMSEASQHHMAAVRPCADFFDACMLFSVLHACVLAFVPSLHAPSICVSGFYQGCSRSVLHASPCHSQKCG